MGNQIIFAATITPASTPMEVTINGGTTYTAATFVTVGSNQQYTLTNVPAGSYAINQLGLRAVGYPATAAYNASAAVPVVATVYNTIITLPAAGTATAGGGITVSGAAGAKIEFNNLVSVGALPIHLDLLIGGTIVAGLDFEGSYIPNQFRYTSPAGTVYFNTNNTFQNTPSGLTLS